MRRLALAFAALTPATAAAAPLGEVPFHTVPEAVHCLAATGAPGELVTWAPRGARLLHATPAGVSEAAAVALGEPRECPRAAAQPNGAGVVAAPVENGIAIALREPGGGWGEPVTIATSSAGLSVAVSERGDAVVAWRELRQTRTRASTVVRVVRRAAGGAFGAPVTLATSDDPGSGWLATGVGGDGAVVVLWSERRGSRSRS